MEWDETTKGSYKLGGYLFAVVGLFLAYLGSPIDILGIAGRDNPHDEFLQTENIIFHIIFLAALFATSWLIGRISKRAFWLMVILSGVLSIAILIFAKFIASMAVSLSDKLSLMGAGNYVTGELFGLEILLTLHPVSVLGFFAFAVGGASFGASVNAPPD